jgi:UDP-N-acetylglucosamine 2-epimerase (non-hydrolysing)
MKKLKIMTIFGTRPEAIKIAPIIMKFEKNQKMIDSRIVVTGQHREMLDQVLEIFDIHPDIDLKIMKKNQSLTCITENTIKGLEKIFQKEIPDLVLVQGDTTTAFASALSAFYHKIPIGHIEAGLRTSCIYDPYPEEMNRRMVSVISSLNFAPTKWSYDNLVKNGIDPDSIYLTGNTVTDALMYILKKRKKESLKKVNEIKKRNKKIILVETHRRENLGEPMRNVCRALKKIIDNFKDYEVVFSVHKNPLVRDVVFSELSNTQGVHLIEPLDYIDLVKLMKDSEFIMTDSGGIQEEGPSLGKPVLVLRNTTERPEGIDAGCAKLVGTGFKDVYEEAFRIISDRKCFLSMCKVKNPYGDGLASQRIFEAILYYFGKRKKTIQTFKG